MVHLNSGDNHPFSLRRNLVLLVVACVLPAASVSALLLYANFKLERANVEHQTALVAHTVLADLEREIAAMESALKTLATSQELVSGDLAGFHARAKQALPSGLVYNYLLTDAEGRQVLNTLQPFGAPLPTTGTPAQLAAVFTRQTTVLTDFFIGPVTRRPAIAMGVPVTVDGGVRYSLNFGLAPDRLSDIVARHPLPSGWLLAVLDSGGTIVARSRDPSRYVGEKAVPELRAATAHGGTGTLQTVTKEGIPVFTAYASSGTWRWSVAVGASTELLQKNMVARLWQVGAGLLLAFGLGLWFARSVVLRVLSSVTGLNQAALALVKGEAVVLPRIQLKEAEAVGQVILEAANAMQKVKFMAQHDPLTGLPNRLLFDEFANRRLALALRQKRVLSLLALDLDGFKGVNDTLGHAAGDDVLKAAARRLESAVRASDMVARIGGDEFMVLLYDVDVTTAMDTAQRMVGLLSAPYAGIPVAVSASVGVAMYGGPGDTLQGLAARADQALYLAKEQGKQRAVLAAGPANDPHAP
jgi:diguanylate cyclase (GGDEF)-like protein